MYLNINTQHFILNDVLFVSPSTDSKFCRQSEYP